MALAIIDVQKGMFAVGEPHRGDEIIAALGAVLTQARAEDAPIFFIQHDGGKDSPIAKGGDGFAFVDALTPQEGDDTTVKNHCSAFHGTDLEAKLRAQGIDEIVIGGMQTEFCVDTAVRGAFERGFKVTLIADGHTTFDTPALPAEQIIAHHNHTLASGHFAKIVAASEITFEAR